jgi:heterodisulfide reductase subunit A-like polyferredoxin
MQAALDLADQGFKVYLVEEKSAIGGKMAQLDKTFPTNDCAMCTISPKLVEVARHPNIEIMTNTEVLQVQGQVGKFTTLVLNKSRYVKEENCVACGDCVKVCPIIVPDPFNESLSQRRAIFKLYPQATPNAFAIQKRGIAPCRDACPAGQRAQGYIALIREGRWSDAMRVIKMDNPFPGICGRICNHRCETACNRGLVDEPINIRALKRFVTEKVYAQPRQSVESIEVKHPDKRVAIIGAGPCGLTAAQDIVREGYPVAVFEAMPVAGGMLRLGVPEFRLPTEIIEREVQDIIDLGVELRLNSSVSNLDDLFDEGFTSVLIAVGAHEGVRLPIPGANLDGVIINTHFLRDVRLDKYTKDEKGYVRTPDGKPFGPRILVLGGGNVAIDVARSAVRLGCQVAMACLEGRDNMPSHPWEVSAALEEGITIHNNRAFEQILGDLNDRVRGVECMQVSSFRFDDSGRLEVEKEPNSNHMIECDTVIFSVGQRAGLAFIPDDAGIGLTKTKTIAINPNTFAATRPGVFAAGDSVSGTAFVIESVNSGHKAAESILRYLGGYELEQPSRPELPVVKLSRKEIEDRIDLGEIKLQSRVPIPELTIEERISNFDEVDGCYDEESAQTEAARCLACGICSECMSCVFACGVNAIDHDMPPREQTLEVGAIIMAPGYEIYRPELSQEYGFGRYPNVVTSLQFERLLSASGPTLGHIQRPSDDSAPQRIAFLQCIGSRDQNHDYCSAVCCMYATKEAIMAKEHVPSLEIQIFMMDMRAFSKGYLEYYERARQRYGVKYARCRVSGLHEDPENHDLILHYQDENGKINLERFNMVVLSVGMEISADTRALGQRLGIELDEHGFCQTKQFNPVETSRPGIFAVGTFRGPKDIPESVVEASGAAAAAAGHLSETRFTLTTTPEFLPERDVTDEAPRIGVFVCHCGSNIAGYLDVKVVTEYAATLPNVAFAESNLYTCSQDSIRRIIEKIAEYQLNRVVVASCTPHTHEPLFRDSLRSAGLNPFLFEMANIRNQCSWVHSSDREAATVKAKDLVRMAVFRAALLKQVYTIEIPVQQTALVVGGGAAGMTAALSLADQGFPVHLIEKESELGGNLRHVFNPMNGKEPQKVLQQLIKLANTHQNIIVHKDSQVVETHGFKGNFTSVIQSETEGRLEIVHGATILATGAREYHGTEYEYGSHPCIITQQDFEMRFKTDETGIRKLNTLVMILCVGPAEQYCSRICCIVALKNAIQLKKLNPGVQVTILYRDIRTYGFNERYYTQAREMGVTFIRYDFQRKPEVTVTNDNPSVVSVKIWEPVLQCDLILTPDLLALSMPIMPNQDTHDLSAMFKVPIDANGFFLEAHVKLRPVDFTTDGIFMAGFAHYPKLLDETMIQAQAAAARAARVLCRTTQAAGGQVAIVDPQLCTGCLTCVRICPFQVPRIQSNLTGTGNLLGAAYIEPAVCQGCGVCAAECPARAIQLMHYTDAQMFAKIGALVSPIPGFVPYVDIQ